MDGVRGGASVGIDGQGGSSGWSKGRCEHGHRWPGGVQWME